MRKAQSLFLFRGINKQERQGIASKSKPDLNFSSNLYPGENIGMGYLGGLMGCPGSTYWVCRIKSSDPHFGPVAPIMACLC